MKKIEIRKVKAPDGSVKWKATVSLDEIFNNDYDETSKCLEQCETSFSKIIQGIKELKESKCFRVINLKEAIENVIKEKENERDIQ